MKNLQSFLNVRDALVKFLDEDIGTGDVTSNCLIPQDLHSRAQIICKNRKSAIVCGLEEMSLVFDLCRCNTKTLVSDGSWVQKGTVVMTIEGKTRSILKAERTALNLLMRMSGIASETRYIKDAIADLSDSVIIASTRKTAPGLRLFDKKAVTIGGGNSHRIRLDDMVLIKDNHLAIIGSVTKSVEVAKKNAASSMNIECEAKNLNEVIEAISAGVDIVMLDNFSPEDADKVIKEISRMGIREKIKLEISGGITMQNIRDYAKAEPDIISVGFLTHSPKAVDFSLEII
ncbi:MAG TPA: carboxylating nicotinate-nucleotide diphosphorylase [Nitrososphaeraceae archaeon]|nr:carboxylating nicotinate-nucleotide diphosphorylase [Nitrososphaeraceae archaeon]